MPDFDSNKIRARHQQLQGIMQHIMVPDVDYASYGDGKPTLRKPGAETLMACYLLVPELETEEIFRPDEDRVIPDRSEKQTRIVHGYYEAISRCTLRSLQGGLALGTLSGSCNSLESGFLEAGVYDLKNTVRKVAEKRAIVAAVLAVTGASRLFTQDLDDNAELRAAARAQRRAAQDTRSNQRQAASAQPVRAVGSSGTRQRLPNDVYWHGRNAELIRSAKTPEALQKLRMQREEHLKPEQRQDLQSLWNRRMAELTGASQQKGAPRKQEGKRGEDIVQRCQTLAVRLQKVSAERAALIAEQAITDAERARQLHEALMELDDAYQAKHVPFEQARIKTMHPDYPWGNQ